MLFNINKVVDRDVFIIDFELDERIHSINKIGNDLTLQRSSINYKKLQS